MAFSTSTTAATVATAKAAVLKAYKTLEQFELVRNPGLVSQVIADIEAARVAIVAAQV